MRNAVEMGAYLTIAAYRFEEVLDLIALHCLTQVLLQTSLAHEAVSRFALVMNDSLSFDDIIGGTTELGLSQRASASTPTKPTAKP